MSYNSLTDDTQATAIHSWNGNMLETAGVTVTSNGTIITLSIEKLGGGNLTVVFSDGYFNWVTAPDTIVLTAGSDISPQMNYVYFLQSTKVITVSTVAFPDAEHAPIATVLCQSAASLQGDGAYKLHAWTDHITQSDDQGHITDVNFWIRNQNASWLSGVNPTLTITPQGGAADDVIFTSAAGVALQLHTHTFPAFTGTPDVYTINDSVTPYNIVTDLNELLTDSAGVSMSGRYFSLVIWGVVSENTSDCKLFVNLPGGSYGNQSNLEADASKFANFSIPQNFRGTGFLIAELKLRHQTAASGTWTEIALNDLRGLFPSIVAGGDGAAQVEFADNTFRIFDEGDPTKEMAFQASGITTATTRTLTVQDADGSIALTNVANFGTGISSATAYAVLCGGTTSTAPFQSIASVGTAGQVLSSNGAAALPTFGTAAVAGGGSGRVSSTAYAVVCGGTTSTAAHQSIASVGTSGQVLTSNGAAALPTFQAAGGGGGGVVVTKYAAAASGTHTLNASTSIVKVVAVAGGGGGSGFAVSRGSGGGAGAFLDIENAVVAFGGAGAGVSYGVGSGGTGGVDADGGDGGDTTFGYITSYGGIGAVGFVLGPARYSGDITHSDKLTGSGGGASVPTEAIGRYVPTGGGKGETSTSGQAGGDMLDWDDSTVYLAGGVGGTGTTGGNGGNGNDGSGMQGGTGAGGGGNNTGGAGGNGGVGGDYGGGGGGGGDGSTVGGDGGAGGDGVLYIVEYLE